MRLFKIKTGAAKLLALVVFSTVFSSFSSKMGGDSFEIFINKKLVVQQFVSHTSGVKSFQLDASNANYQVDVYYSHCGKSGTSRNIIIKDGENHLLKEWHFSDASGSNTPMSCKVKDLLNIGKTNGTSKLNIYYSSKELPKGRLLAAVLLNTDNKVTP
jgi:hypothetical protein